MTRLLWFLIISILALLLWSAIHPHDYFTWFLEVLPALGGWTICALTFRRFRLSNLMYVLIWLHSIVLIIGGHYTYAEVPLFNWIRDTFHTQRNSYDGIGHFMQGFAPAIYAREILIRLNVVKRGGWLFFIVVMICLGLSAFYELVEWWVSIASGSAGDSFLGGQGDIWDTQKDMFLCLIGSIIGLITLSKLHDRSLEKLAATSNA
jgi:putative membrane protein